MCMKNTNLEIWPFYDMARLVCKKKCFYLEKYVWKLIWKEWIRYVHSHIFKVRKIILFYGQSIWKFWSVWKRFSKTNETYLIFNLKKIFHFHHLRHLCLFMTFSCVFLSVLNWLALVVLQGLLKQVTSSCQSSPNSIIQFCNIWDCNSI